MAVLHFHQAVSEHHAWWERFEEFLQGHTDDLEREHVAHDHSCTIGRWLHGDDGAVFAHHPEFQAVKALHKRLHNVAGELWQARVDEAQERMQQLLDDAKQIRHELFMAWSALNEIVGVYE